MELQHLQAKLFVQPPVPAGALEALPGLFNQWIQAQPTPERVLPELLVDVADYRHVPSGPGVLLIGHEANYSLDETGGRPGLLYNRKAPEAGDNLARLAQAVGAALAAARRLERENALRFSGREVEIIVNDRLLAPNTPATFAALQPDLNAFFGQLFGGVSYRLTHLGEPRQRFSVNALAAAELSLETLQQNLSALDLAHA